MFYFSLFDKGGADLTDPRRLCQYYAPTAAR